VRSKFSQNSDTIFIVAMIGIFIAGGGLALWQSHVTTGSWETDFSQTKVPLDEIVPGAMKRDQISPIDHPDFDSISEASTWLDAHAPVIAITLDEQARAYPLAVLIRHEIVNDQIGEHYFAVTFCPLCNSAIVFDRRIHGRVARMGVSGDLYHSGFIMWDNLTQTWWHQFTGEAIVGEYVGMQLDIIPSQVVGFQTFAERFPYGIILAGDTQKPNLTYDRNPYIRYDSGQSPLMSTADYDERLLPMERVMAALVDGVPVAYPFRVLSQRGIVNDRVNDRPVVVFWQPGALSALDAADLSRSRDVGMAAVFGRVVNERVLSFRYEAGRIFDNETESEWNIFGEAIAGDLAGEQLTRYQCFPHFWFAWSTAYPETMLYQS